MLVIELDNVLGGRGETLREFLNLLRFWAVSCASRLVGVGIRDVCLAVRSEDGLENAPLTLPRSAVRR